MAGQRINSLGKGKCDVSLLNVLHSHIKSSVCWLMLKFEMEHGREQRLPHESFIIG